MPKHKSDVQEQVLASMLKSRLVQLHGGIVPSDLTYLECIFNHFKFGPTSKQKVTLSMNTPGGSVYDALALYDLIKTYRKHFPIHIHVSGVCISAGVPILQAASRRTASPHSTFMVHEVSLGTGGYQTVTQQAGEVKEALRLQKLVNEIIAEHSLLNFTKLRRTRGPVDHYYTAEQALELKLIDEITTLES